MIMAPQEPREDWRPPERLQELETIFLTAPIGLAVLDLDLRYVRLNERLAAINGVSVEEHIGRTVQEIMPDLSEQAEEVLRTLLETGNPQLDREFSGQTAASPGVTRWFCEQWHPVREQNGDIVGVSVVVEDITEKRRMEHELRESEARLRTALLAGHMATWRWTVATDEVVPSDTMADVFGLRPGDTFQDSARGFGLVHPDDVQRHRALVEAAVRGGGSWHSEFRIIRPRDGKVAWLEERAVATRDPTTGQVHVDGLVWDITDRKQAEAALLEADKQKNEFLAVISHELKNPLNLIQLNAELLLRLPEAQTQPALSRAADAVRDAVSRLAHLVDDLLDLSRINTGKLALKRSVFDLSQSAKRILAAAERDAAAKAVAIVTDIDREVLVDGDVTRVEQIIWNLLSNALKFTPPGGQIDVRLWAQTDEAALEVRDTGRGIDPKVLPRIFDMFVQEDASTTREQGGLGIGLALVHHIATLHDGRVEAHSPGRGQGATFRVYLPLAAAAPADSDTRRDPHATRLLLVEDEPHTASLLRQLIELEGYQVELAADGQDAFEKATGAGSFDLIVSDIGMPNMDGWELIQLLRSHVRTARIPAVAVTALNRDQNHGQLVAAGFDDVVPKPVKLESLLAAIETALKKRQMGR